MWSYTDWWTDKRTDEHTDILILAYCLQILVCPVRETGCARWQLELWRACTTCAQFSSGSDPDNTPHHFIPDTKVINYKVLTVE